MLYGVHVFARAKVVPDLMIARGVEAHRLARTLGDRSIEFLAAGGVAMCHLDLGEQSEAEEWVGRAATAAASSPTPLRARQLATWRGLCSASAGNVDGMREHLGQALKMATDTGRPAARCEALAQLALSAARTGAARHDEELLALGEQSAQEAIELAGLLTGHPSWGPRAQAALATVALERGELERAVTAAGTALAAMQEALQEDANLDILLPAARAVLNAGPAEAQQQIRWYLQLTLSRIAQGVVDDQMRVRWLRGPLGSELAELAGPMEQPPQAEPEAAADGASPIDQADRQLLRLLTQGSTNREIAEELSIDEGEVAQRLARLLAAIGASTRAQATSLAFRSVMSS